MPAKRRPYPDLDAMEAHAGLPSIEWHLARARRLQRAAERVTGRLEAMLAMRLEQVERGEWPPKPGEPQP